MKVKIIKSSPWHNCPIGEVFNATKVDGTIDGVMVIDNGDYLCSRLHAQNYEVLEESIESEYADSGHTYYCQKPKAGDKVKCTDACADPRLETGEIYTVTYVNLDGSVRLGGIGHVHYYLESFKLVSRAGTSLLQSEVK